MQKICFLLTVILLAVGHAYAQSQPGPGFLKAELPVVNLSENLSVHFVSPEPIRYVDISTQALSGDLPVKNILRIRRRTDSVRLANAGGDAVVTIVGETFIAQYRIAFVASSGDAAIRTDIEVQSSEMRPLDFPGVSLSTPELKGYAWRVMGQKPEKHLRHAAAYGIRANLNHVFTLGDYIFLDVSLENETHLAYDMEEIRFVIEDQKVNKATTVQTVPVEPDLTLMELRPFKKHYRNVFVFRKFTFPGHKKLVLAISEKQLSGRTLSLEVPYREVLDADVLPTP